MCLRDPPHCARGHTPMVDPPRSGGGYARGAASSARMYTSAML
jgi:hypothetical protein